MKMKTMLISLTCFAFPLFVNGQTIVLRPVIKTVANTTFKQAVCPYAAAGLCLRKTAPMGVRINVSEKKLALATEKTLRYDARMAQAVQHAQNRFWRVNMLKKHKTKIINAYHLTEDFLNGYYARRIQPYLEKPSYRADANAQGYVFRGMYITVDELATVLEKGFELKHTSWNTGAKGNANIISFSTSSGEAMSYVFQSANVMTHPGGIGVVFKVRQSADMHLFEDPILNSTNTIYHTYQNVHPSQIEEVSLYGKWGMELLDGRFRPEIKEGVLEKAEAGKLSSNEDWIHSFDIQFLR